MTEKTWVIKSMRIACKEHCGDIAEWCMVASQSSVWCFFATANDTVQGRKGLPRYSAHVPALNMQKIQKYLWVKQPLSRAVSRPVVTLLSIENEASFCAFNLSNLFFSRWMVFFGLGFCCSQFCQWNNKHLELTFYAHGVTSVTSYEHPSAMTREIQNRSLWL